MVKQTKSRHVQHQLEELSIDFLSQGQKIIVGKSNHELVATFRLLPQRSIKRPQ